MASSRERASVSPSCSLCPHGCQYPDREGGGGSLPPPPASTSSTGVGRGRPVPPPARRGLPSGMVTTCPPRGATRYGPVPRDPSTGSRGRTASGSATHSLARGSARSPIKSRVTSAASHRGSATRWSLLRPGLHSGVWQRKGRTHLADASLGTRGNTLAKADNLPVVRTCQSA
jgi:hypothetical protein